MRNCIPYELEVRPSLVKAQALRRRCRSVYHGTIIKDVNQEADGTLHTGVDIVKNDGSVVNVATIHGWTKTCGDGEKQLGTDIHFNSKNLFQDDHYLEHISQALQMMENHWKHVQNKLQ
jgi:hypothetical protein